MVDVSGQVEERCVYLLQAKVSTKVRKSSVGGGRYSVRRQGVNSRSSSHLSSLALETSNSLLSPLGSHREREFWAASQ